MHRMTTLLIALNALVFAMQVLLGDGFTDTFALWPPGERLHAWQLVSYAFLHGSLAHLFVNLFGLWMFGREVERALGSQRFLTLYFVSLVAAALTQLLTMSGMGAQEPTVGASGAVFGILGAFALLFPRRIIVLLIPPIPLPAPIFVAGYAAVELLLGVYNSDAGVAHFAHLGGLAGGLLSIALWRRQRTGRG